MHTTMPNPNIRTVRFLVLNALQRQGSSFSSTAREAFTALRSLDSVFQWQKNDDALLLNGDSVHAAVDASCSSWAGGGGGAPGRPQALAFLLHEAVIVDKKQ